MNYLLLADDMSEDELLEAAREQREARRVPPEKLRSLADALATALNARMGEVGDAVKGMRR